MIENFDGFYSRLRSFVKLDDSFRQHFQSETRPRSTEVLEHRRSGQTGQFTRKLQAVTLEKLNAAFAGILREYGYEADGLAA